MACEAQLAIDDLTTAISLDVNYRDAYNNRGMAYSDLFMYDDALKDFDKAIELDDKYWYALNNRGMLLWKIGEKDAAVKDYEKVRVLLSNQ